MYTNHTSPRSGAARSGEPAASDIDLIQLRGFLGTDASELSAFLADAESTLRLMGEDLDGAVARRDLETIREIAHEASGTCANIGAIGLASLGRTLSLAVKRADWTTLQMTSERVSAGIERFLTFLRSEASALR